jgi:nucleoid DNA-binding protein
MATTLQNEVNHLHENLSHAISVGSDDALVAALRNIKSTDQSAKDTILRIIRETNSSRVRNAAAIALADIRAPNATDVLVELLADPKTENSRGTLLYAIEELNGTVPLETLVDIILSGTYESREEALRLLTSGRAKSTPAELRMAGSSLDKAAPLNEEEADSIKRAKDAIRAFHRNARRQSSTKITLSSANLVATTAASCKVQKMQVRTVLDGLVALLRTHLKRGETVRLRGLGAFAVRRAASKRSAKALKWPKALKKAKTIVASPSSTRGERIVFRPSPNLLAGRKKNAPDRSNMRNSAT